MLTEDLPSCECGAHDFAAGEVYVGPSLSFQHWRCNPCGRQSTVVNGILLRAQNPDDLNKYANNVLLPTIRYWREYGVDGVPPQLPDTLVCYMRSQGGWQLVSKEASAAASVPEDPIVTSHRATWAPLIKLFARFGIREIPNQYDEESVTSWYELVFGGVTIQFGPRRSVIALRASGSVPCSRLCELSKRDGTSFWADDGWRPDAVSEAHTVEIHAWSMGRFIEYLDALLLEILGADQRMHKSVHS